jgi:hypothetical protein
MKWNIKVLITCALAVGLALSAGLTTQPVGATSNFCDSPKPDGLVWYVGRPVTEAGWLEKGATFESQIEVCNDNTETRQLNVYATPYSIAQNDYTGVDFISKTTWNKLSEWISFPAGDNFTIASGQTIYIPFKITVPTDGSAITGSQAASIMLEGAQVYGDGDESAVLSTKRFLWVAYANINGDGLRQSGDILEWRADGSVLFSNENGLNTYSLIENTGNVSFTSQHHVTITDLFRNEAVAYDKEGKMMIMPESKRANEFKWGEAPAAGLFKITEQISYLDQVKHFEKIVLIFPLWLLIIVAIIIVLLVAALIMKIRNYREGKQSD